MRRALAPCLDGRARRAGGGWIANPPPFRASPRRQAALASMFSSSRACATKRACRMSAAF